MAHFSGKQRLLLALFVICALVFAVSAGMAAKEVWQAKQEAQAFAALRAEKETLAREKADAAQARAARYDSLQGQNSDYACWLTVTGTAIDYPVMWTPNEPEYYLRRAFDKSQSASGTPFIGEGSDVDSDCLIIYGHQMNNGTMFGELDKYEDADFAAQKQLITVETRTETRTYEVFAAVKTRLLGAGEAGYRYYNAAGKLDKESFDELVTWARGNALYDTGIRPNYGEQILMLSTCSYHTENGRFIVVAHRLS